MNFLKKIVTDEEDDPFPIEEVAPAPVTSTSSAAGKPPLPAGAAAGGNAGNSNPLFA